MEPEARRGPACTCCRRGKVRVHVLTRGNYAAWACPLCDRVQPNGDERVDRPLDSAPKAPESTS